jgi:type II secretory pathway pseudopilin PulG
MVMRGRSDTPRRRRPSPTGEAGYNLVILMVAVTVMTILVAAALPSWTTAVRRDKEEELIFRGLQYVEAIRVFQQRFGRLPVRLEELIEVEPRSIRQLWRDPFTGERDWVTIRGDITQAVPGAPPPDPDGRDEGADTPDLSGAQGPIRGVRSRHRGDALKTFFDKDRYEQWLFTIELMQGMVGANVNVEGVGVPRQVNQPRLQVRWLGRPFRPGIQPPAMGGDSGLGGGLPSGEVGDPPPGDGG